LQVLLQLSLLFDKMLVKTKKVKNHKKTLIGFRDTDEAIQFLEEQTSQWDKCDLYLTDMTDQERMLNPKQYFLELVNVFKRFRGTNIDVIMNSPITLMMNGHHRFKGVDGRWI